MKPKEIAACVLLLQEIEALSKTLRTGATGLRGSGREILSSLEAHGSQTAPQLARARGVSRQHIQTIAHALLKDGLIATAENPAHRRSFLLSLTAKGERSLRAVLQRQTKALAHIPSKLTAKEMDRASVTLEAVRRILESKEWKRHAA